MSVPEVLPPSPPNTSHRHRNRLQGPTYQLVNPVASTPDDSPSSLLLSSGNASRKRVEFSPWTNVLDAPSSEPSSDASALKALPRSKDCHTVAKSILKPQTEQEVHQGSDGTVEPPQSITMDSLVRALTNNDKITSIDAYQSLAHLIKAYDELPDDTDTRGNVVSIVRSIKRDLGVQEQGLSTPVDINLVTQALKVTVILVWSEQFSRLLPDDFKIFITDRSVNVLAEHTLPKVIVIHYMHVLATQSFKAAIFTSGNRTVRLLDALREITTHVPGKGIIAERLLVYQKLIEQAKPIMKAKAGLWIREVLTSLSSPVKEIRDKAISVCSRSVAAFPASPTVSQAARDALADESKERTLSSILTQRLDRMIVAKDEALQVPQIWSLVMLLCNSLDARLDTWAHIREWLRVIQRCFNCSDINVRIQAFPAWNRFIFIVKPHEASEAMMTMLAKPIAAQIERTGANPSSKGSRPSAVSSYCTLLYYAFRPAASHKQYTRSWNEYVVKMATTQFLSKSPANADLCSRVLMALFWKDTHMSRIWNENRAHDNKLMEPEELPTIDYKWIRAKSGPILDIFKLLFQHSVWGPSVQHSEQAFVARAWRSFVRAIREAACKEIKPTPDTKKALSSCLRFLHDAHVSEKSEVAEGEKHSTRTKLACRILNQELGPAAILDVTSQVDKTKIPDILLAEVLQGVLQKLSSTTDVVNIQKLTHPFEPTAVPLPGDLQKALSLLNYRLEQTYSGATESSAALHTILDTCATVLPQIPDTMVLQCLKLLQHGLATVVEDVFKICDPCLVPPEAASSWRLLFAALIKKLAVVDFANYVELDRLIAAILSSKRVFVVSDLLKMWENADVAGGTGNYGPLVETAVNAMRSEVDIDLPGLQRLHPVQGNPSEVLRTVFDVQMLPDRNVLAKGSPELSAMKLNHPFELVQKQERDANNDARRLHEQNNARPRREPSHNSSQIVFQPIESSPTNIDDLESQMLTERQKDVRHRQRIESTITFADLRSSPLSKGSRSSRAASADCEMARKLAALDDLPTTPTIARHAVAMDDAAIPSPTPKARKQTFCLADIEIPSSPPSAVGNRNLELELQELISSPARVADGAELGVLDLEKAQDARLQEIVIEQVVEEHKPTPVDADAPTLQGDVSVSDVLVHAANMHEPERMQVDDDIQDVDINQLKDNDEAQVLDSDEDPSASQLSQSLDWHIREEAGPSPVPTPGAVREAELQRKRKREDTNQINSSGRRSRKRISTSSGGPASTSTTPNEPEGSRSVTQRAQATSSGTDIMSSPAPATRTRLHTSDLRQSFSSPTRTDDTYVRPRRSRRVANSGRGKANGGVVSQHEGVAGSNSGSQPVQVTELEALESTDEQAANNIRHETSTTDGEVEKMPHIPTEVAEPTDDIISALQLALNGLKDRTTERDDGVKSVEIDLKAIDDLCFQIRFQAQEIWRTKKLQQ